MSISPVGGMPTLPSLPGVQAPVSPEAVTGTEAAEGFGQMLSDSLHGLQNLHTTSDRLGKAAATGDLTDVHDYTIASAQAAVATEMTVAFRNRAVEAFTEIMRMPI